MEVLPEAGPRTLLCLASRAVHSQRHACLARQPPGHNDLQLGLALPSSGNDNNINSSKVELPREDGTLGKSHSLPLLQAPCLARGLGPASQALRRLLAGVPDGQPQKLLQTWQTLLRTLTRLAEVRVGLAFLLLRPRPGE